MPPSRDVDKGAPTVDREGSGSVKRRKLDVNQPSSSRSSRSTLRTPRRDIYSLEEEEEEENNGRKRDEVEVQASEEQDELSPVAFTGNGQSPVIIEGTMDEVAESPRDAPGSGSRRRIRVLRNRAQSKDTDAVRERSTAEAPANQRTMSSPTVTRRPGKPRRQPSPDLTEERPTPRRESQRTVNDDFDELSPEQPLRRGRRSLASSRKEQFSDEEAEEADEVEEAEEIDDMQIAARLGRKQTRVNPEQDSAGDTEGSDESISSRGPGRSEKSRLNHVRSEGLSTQISSPVVQRQPKPPKRQKRRSGQPTGTRRDAIPITVHRLTKALIPDEDNDETDILNSDVPLARRGGVNAVDVLAQFCEEIVSAGLAALEETGMAAKEPAVRRELRTKLRAVEAFQGELRTRLLELVRCLTCGSLT